MNTLYLDTTCGLVLGLLDEKNQWVELVELVDSKNSAQLHGRIYELLEKNNLTFQAIDSFVYSAGPGSYTGVRLAQGVGQILGLAGKKVYSFYHFDIPTFLSSSSLLEKDEVPLWQHGLWVSHAFKNEVFVFEWNEKERKSSLLSYDDFKQYLKKLRKEYLDNSLNIFLHSPLLLNEHFQFLSEEFSLKPESTSEILLNNSAQIFQRIKNLKLASPPYYYRSLEQEFKVTFHDRVENV